MSCVTFAARNQTSLKSFLKNVSVYKFASTVNSSSNSSKKIPVKQVNDSDPPISDYTIPPADPKDEGEQFRYLLRNSSFINMGDPENKIVQGKIFHTVKDDLYVDFGWKFYCVCPRPTKNGRLYVRGATVLLKIKDLELSTKFLGSEKDLTLLEADASIIKMLHSPLKAD